MDDLTPIDGNPDIVSLDVGSDLLHGTHLLSRHEQNKYASEAGCCTGLECFTN